MAHSPQGKHSELAPDAAAGGLQENVHSLPHRKQTEEGNPTSQGASSLAGGLLSRLEQALPEIGPHKDSLAPSQAAQEEPALCSIASPVAALRPTLETRLEALIRRHERAEPRRGVGPLRPSCTPETTPEELLGQGQGQGQGQERIPSSCPATAQGQGQGYSPSCLGTGPEALARHGRSREGTHRSARAMAPPCQGEVLVAGARECLGGFVAQWGAEQDWASEPEGGTLGVHRQWEEGLGGGAKQGEDWGGRGEEEGEGERGGEGDGEGAEEGDGECLQRQPQYMFPPSSSNRSLPGRLEPREQVQHMGSDPPATLRLSKEHLGAMGAATLCQKRMRKGVPAGERAPLTKEHSWPPARRDEGRVTTSSRDIALVQATEDHQSGRAGVPPAFRFQASGIPPPPHSGGRGERELYPRFLGCAGAPEELNPGSSDLDMDGATSVCEGEGMSQGSCGPAGEFAALLAFREGTALGEGHLEPGQVESPAAREMEIPRPHCFQLPSQERAQMCELRQQREAQAQEGQAMLRELTQSQHSDTGAPEALGPLGQTILRGLTRSQHSDTGAPELWQAAGVPSQGRGGYTSGAPLVSGEGGKGGARGAGASRGECEGLWVSSGRAELIRRWQIQSNSQQSQPQQQPHPPLKPLEPRQLEQAQQQCTQYQQPLYQEQPQQEGGLNQIPTTQQSKPRDNPADAILEEEGPAASDAPFLEPSGAQRTGSATRAARGVPCGMPRDGLPPGGSVEQVLLEHLSLVKPEPGSLGEALLSSTRLAMPLRGTAAAAAADGAPTVSSGLLTLPAHVSVSPQSPSLGLRTQAAGVRLPSVGTTAPPPGTLAQGAGPGMPQKFTVLLEGRGSSDESMELEGGHEGVEGVQQGSPGDHPKEVGVSTECRGQGRHKRIMRERERRSNVRVQLKRLRSLLPRDLADNAAHDTVSLISTAVTYIKHLKSKAGEPEDG